MLLCGSAVRPADSFKVVPSPLDDRFMKFAKRFLNRSLKNEKDVTKRRKCADANMINTRKSQNERRLPLAHPRPGSRVARVHTPFPRPLLSNRPICRLPLARSLGSREYSGPGTALLLGAILLLPSHCPRGSLSPLLCHPLPPRLKPLDRPPETGPEDQS